MEQLKKSSIVLALGKRGRITALIKDQKRVHYIMVRLDGEKKSRKYHPTDVNLVVPEERPDKPIEWDIDEIFQPEDAKRQWDIDEIFEPEDAGRQWDIDEIYSHDEIRRACERLNLLSGPFLNTYFDKKKGTDPYFLVKLEAFFNSSLIDLPILDFEKTLNNIK